MGSQTLHPRAVQHRSPRFGEHLVRDVSRARGVRDESQWRQQWQPRRSLRPGLTCQLNLSKTLVTCAMFATSWALKFANSNRTPTSVTKRGTRTSERFLAVQWAAISHQIPLLLAPHNRRIHRRFLYLDERKRANYAAT
jgi:hypothetical protein